MNYKDLDSERKDIRAKSRHEGDRYHVRELQQTLLMCTMAIVTALDALRNPSDG